MRLLIVDDSALMRTMLTDCFATEEDVTIATARNGREALEKVESFDPDVVTLDINMPEMDGLTCLAYLMETAPRPVIMVSSLTEKGALASFEALELGALDFIAKPGGTVSLNLREKYHEIRSKVKSAARTRRRPTVPPEQKERPNRRRQHARETDLVLIGVSTGGPGTLETVLGNLPASYPAPVLIAQHMPPKFTRVLAERLDQRCALDVIELTRAGPLEPGKIYLVSGGLDVEVVMRFGRLSATCPHHDKRFNWHPSVSRMVASALRHIDPERLIGVQLTGMGDDGAAEFAELHARGGRTIAQSESSSVIFGMPKALIDLGGATEVLRAERIGQRLAEWTAAPKTSRTALCR